MIASAIALLLVMQSPTVSGTVRDALSNGPVEGAVVRGRSVSRTNGVGRFTLGAAPGDTLIVRRIGYREARAVVGDGDVEILMHPAAATLAAVDVSARVEAGRALAVRTAESARIDGAVNTREAIAGLPYVAARGAHGELSLSMRGSRASQVLVLLDGVPLNDPALGAADVGDLPLGALGALSASPGADAGRYGTGASGGTIGLTTGSGSTASISAGSYGAWRAEGVMEAGRGSRNVRAGVSASGARNDFTFLNTAGASTDPDSVERRTNADDRTVAAFATVRSSRIRSLVLISQTERGMAGRMNVREFDKSRLRSHRALGHLATNMGQWTMSGSAHALGTEYRPRPDGRVATTRTLSVDVAGARMVRGGALLRVGGGVDAAGGTVLDAPRRPRAFAALARDASWRAWALSLALRGDAIAHGGQHLSASAGVERRGRLAPFARIGRGFRAPTFADLFLVSSAQPLSPAIVRPERVVLDVEVGLRARTPRVLAEATAFARDTRDAIVWFPGFASWSPRNVGVERARGGEVRIASSLGPVRFDAWGGAYASSFDTVSVRVPVPYAPNFVAGSTVRTGRGPVSAALALSAVGRRPFEVAPADASLELPAYMLADLAVTLALPSIRPGASLLIGVRNLADTQWESVRGFPVVGRTWTAGFSITPTDHTIQ